MWRIMSVHLHNEHVNKRREHGRKTVADMIGLALRDEVDIVTGDWNQAGWYLEETTYWEVRLYEKSKGLTPGTVQWAIPGPTYEIRTIFFNWPKNGMVYDMFVKDMSKFRHCINEDFGLRAQDGDAHLPQFFMIRKHEKFSNRSKAPSLANIPPHLRPQSTRAFHTRTTTGQAADTLRYRNKRAAKRQAKAAARVAEAPSSERQNKGKGKSKAPWETGMRYASPIGSNYRPHTKGTNKGKR